MSDNAVTPRDCALIVAIPRTLRDLEEDLSRTNREFARRVILPLYEATTAQGAWEHGYQAFIEQVAKITAEIEALGVTVVEDACLCDLARTLTAFKVVTLVAHSPFPLFDYKDILDPERVMNAIREYTTGVDNNPVIERLTREEDVREAITSKQLARALNWIIDRTRSFFQATGSSGIKLRGDLTSLHIYEAFPGAFRPPAILELRDGIHDFEAFCKVVPEHFEGTMEFLACSGLWFGEPLRRRRPNCGDFLCPKQPADIGGRITIYRIVIRLLASYPMGYTNAVYLVHTAERDA